MLHPPLLFSTLTLLVAIVGVVGAALSGAWDLFAMFLVILGLQVIVLLQATTDRVPVSLRPDLARWATQRSHRTGEPVDDVIDRSVAWFQHGLYASSQADGE